MGQDNLDIHIRARDHDLTKAIQRVNKMLGKMERQTARQFKSMNRHTTLLNKNFTVLGRTMNAFGRVSGVLGAVTIGVYALQRAVRAFGQAADPFTELTNRIRIVAAAERELTQTRRELFVTSRKTFSEVKTNAVLYSRLSLAGDKIGLSDAENLRLVSSINKQIQLGGATPQEAMGGLIQFTQSISKGRLDGDELRSVTENLPVMIETLIKGFAKMKAAGKLDFSVTKKNLRDLAAQGRITSAMIVESLLTMEKEVDEAFKKITPTIAATNKVWANSIVQLVGHADAAIGASKAYNAAANAFSRFAHNITLDPQSLEGMKAYLKQIQEFEKANSGYTTPIMQRDRSGLNDAINILEKEKLKKLRDEDKENAIVKSVNSGNYTIQEIREKLNSKEAEDKELERLLKAIDKTTKSGRSNADKLKSAQALLTKRFKSGGYATREANDKFERETGRSHTERPASPEELKQYLNDMRGLDKQFSKSAKSIASQIDKATQSLSSGLENSILGFITGAKTIKDVMRDLATSVITEFMRIAIAQPIATAGANLFNSFLQSTFNPSAAGTATRHHGPPGRAAGGVVNSGSAYTVGERGREIFVPNRNGRIYNNNQSESIMSGRGGGAGGGTVIVNQNNSFEVGELERQISRQIQKHTPSLIEASKAAVLEAKRNGGQFAAEFS